MIDGAYYLERGFYIPNPNRSDPIIEPVDTSLTNAVVKLLNKKKNASLSAAFNLIDESPYARDSISAARLLHATIEQTRRFDRDHLAVFGDFITFPILRYTLRSLSSNPDLKYSIDKYSRERMWDNGQEIFLDVGEVYRRADFNSYQPYSDLANLDIAIASRVLGHYPKIVDIGCGEGRHLTPMHRAGYQMIGVDIDPRSFKTIHTQHPELDLRVGSMTNLPLEDSSVDGAYILGRGITHNLTQTEYLQTLLEIYRVLRPGGRAIIDIPNLFWGGLGMQLSRTRFDLFFHNLRTKDLSAILSKDYSKESHTFSYNGEFAPAPQLFTATPNGLKGFETEGGIVNDSPDNIHYFDRLLPGEKEIFAWALLSGFNPRSIFMIDDANYRYNKGGFDYNRYIVLDKRNEDSYNLTEKTLIHLGLKYDDYPDALLSRVRNINNSLFSSEVSNQDRDRYEEHVLRLLAKGGHFLRINPFDSKPN